MRYSSSVLSLPTFLHVLLHLSFSEINPKASPNTTSYFLWSFALLSFEEGLHSYRTQSTAVLNHIIPKNVDWRTKPSQISLWPETDPSGALWHGKVREQRCQHLAGLFGFSFCCVSSETVVSGTIRLLRVMKRVRGKEPNISDIQISFSEFNMTEKIKERGEKKDKIQFLSSCL